MRLFDLSAWRSHKDDDRIPLPIDALKDPSALRRALVTGGIAAAGAMFATKAKAAAGSVVLEQKNLATRNTTVINTQVDGAGLRGVAQHGTAANGVYGGSADGAGVRGTGYKGMVGEGTYIGVHGDASSQGVRGESEYVGVWGEGESYGLYGHATQTTGAVYGLMGSTDSPAGYGVYSIGNAHVAGTLSKTAGSFKIDHPLDPERKWLQHSFVESPDMMNVYNGNVTTDAAGYATVELPPYFDALNSDYRYQLTVIGKMAQAIVDREIVKNTFRIRTSEGHVKVSWQVTGVRQDDYANAHRIKVEIPKSLVELGTRQFVLPGSAAKKMDPRPRSPDVA